MLVRKNLKDIANKSDSFGIATVYCDIASYKQILDGSISLDKKYDEFFSVLHSFKSDANCSRNTKYVSELVKDFLHRAIRKTVIPNSQVVCLPQYDDFLISGNF